MVNLKETLIDFGLAAGIGLGVMLVLLLARHAFLKWFRRLAAARIESKFRHLLVEALPRPTLLLSVAGGLAAALEGAPLPARLAAWGNRGVAVLVIFAITLGVAGAGTRALHLLGERAKIETATTGLGIASVRALTFSLGGLMVLSALGVAVTPLFAALGIGGLAMGLALQDTLSNLFAGIHLVVDKPLRVGDYMRLETGQEGTVLDIGWRTTRIRMPSNMLAVVPNAKLAQSVLVNYSCGRQRLSLLLPVSVGPEADPEAVEKILVEEAIRAAEVVPGLLIEPPPQVRFLARAGEASPVLTLIVPARTSVDQQQAQHELWMRMLRRLRQEGIEVRGCAAAGVSGSS
jgi:small-conductance mechanosensitive channel